MKKYETPVVEIEMLETSDIMAASTNVSVEQNGDDTYAGTSLKDLLGF
jgi:hypothetical protein